MPTLEQRHRDNATGRALLHAIARLTSQPPAEGRLISAAGGRTRRLHSVDVAWEHAAAVRDLATASGLPITVHDLSVLELGTHDALTRIETAIPARDLAGLFAGALLTIDDGIADGLTVDGLTLPADSIHDALTRIDHGPQRAQLLHILSGPLFDLAARGPFGTRGPDTPLNGMLTTLLLDAADLDAHRPIRAWDMPDSISRLLDGLTARPWLIDTARALTADTPDRAVTVTRSAAVGPAITLP